MEWKQTRLAATAAVALVLAPPVHAQAPADRAAAAATQEHVAALKISLKDGLAKIRQYEWIETTTVRMKGEEKNRKQNRCYYGADGTIQKLPLEEPAAAQVADERGGRGGRRGGRIKEKVVENKKEEIQDYMHRAAQLIHGYVPPASDKIQAAVDAGRVKVTPKAAGQVQVAIAHYLQPGDELTIGLDVAANRLLAVGVKSYLDTPDDPVTLDVTMSTLPDGALYASEATLDVPAQKMTVVIQNSGHRRVAR